MKRFFLLNTILFFATIIHAQSKPATAQYANTTLSNLTSPTKIKLSLLPDTTNKRSIGNSTKSWKNIYIGDTLFLNNEPYIKFNDASNAMFGNDAGAGILGSENCFFGT